ncbi:MAG: FHA domain-containing protein [Bifidobacteriaceae bacterium]|nr:FHA domain-containing protein [Bifidobacteriaceae bacterium]
MLTDLTFAILKYSFLLLLWVFLWLAVRSIHKDVATLSPSGSRSQHRAKRRGQKNSGRIANNKLPLSNSTHKPTLLVVIDGPIAGTSIALNGEPITLGRASTNTIVLNDEFVSSHHARVYKDIASDAWAIEDLGSTNGTIVNQKRLDVPTILPARVPVRIGATTFELR